MLLVRAGGQAVMADWIRQFAAVAPDLDVRWWDDPAVPPEAVRYALVWEPEPGRLARLPNLRLICSSAAGVDHIVRDPAWPAHLPVVRMGGEETAQRMGEYVALASLALLRDLKRMTDNQARARWDFFMLEKTAPDTRAGVMGLGNLGQRAAAVLRDLGFQTAGWSRSGRAVPGVESFAGPDAFDAFLARTDLLVCLLPDTEATRGVIRAETIARLPEGAGIVNAARGAHVVVPDLIAALDRGHLSGAVLDVFDPEPLPADSPLWSHPRVIVTPHAGSLATRRARARYVAEVIARFERGEALPNLYDPQRGY